MAIAVVGGGLGGGVAGLIAAILSLQARRVRNHILAGRGEPGLRDCVLPTVFVPLAAIGGVVVAAVLVWFVAPVPAAIAGALAPAGLLVLISIASLLSQVSGR